MSIVEINNNGKKYYEVRLAAKDAQKKRVQIKRRFLTRKKAQEQEFKLKCELLDVKQAYAFKKWSEKCLERIRVQLLNSTYQRHKGILRKWIFPCIGNLLLKDITTSNIHDLVFSIDILSSHSRKNVLKTTRKIFQMAVDDGILHRNPTVGIKVKVAEAKQKVLNKEEIQILLKSANNYNHRYYPIWVLALLTGMRSGELFALKWTDIDFSGDLIHVNKAWSRFNGLTTTKTAKNRVVPISKECSLFLKDLKMKFPEEKFVLPRLRDWESGDQARVLREFCYALNITPVRFHDLRATFITQMLINGAPLAKVMSIVGHASLRTTQGYLRLCGEDVKGATESLNLKVPCTKGGIGTLIQFPKKS